MKIALDFDGVIDRAPALFAAISKSLRADGHEVHVISDFDETFRRQREKELAGFGIEYDVFAITADKAAYCLEHELDYSFDDDPHEYFPGLPVVLLGVIATRRATT